MERVCSCALYINSFISKTKTVGEKPFLKYAFFLGLTVCFHSNQNDILHLAAMFNLSSCKYNH